MASRRMRIKAVAKVPSVGKSRGSDRPTTPICGYTEPSSPAPDVSRGSPKTPVQVMSPLSYPPSPTQKVLNTSDDRLFPISSPGLMSPKSPYRSSYPSAPTSPMPPGNPVTMTTTTNPESPRRPTTPLTPSSFHGENSQDKLIMSPVYSPSYSAFSPGVGPGISVSISRAPTPMAPSPGMSEDSNSSIASSSRSISRVSTSSKSVKPPKRPPPFSNSSQSNSALKEALSPGTSLISAALNNSETLRQRLQKGTVVPSTSKYAMIRKDYLAKYQNKIPDPKDLTMLHYAFFNPPKGELAEGDEKVVGEDGVILPGKPVANKRRRRTESRDSVASSVSMTSNPPPPVAEKEPTEDEPAGTSQSVGPRVKVGPDGQLIIDEQSLVIQTSESQRAKKQLAEMETVSGSSYIVGSSGLYSRKKPLKRGVDWDEKETMKFYKALITCGTDFSMMATVFKGTRSRSELKAKFKREDRRNPQQVSRALSKQCFDPTLALTDSEEDEESIIADASHERSTDSNDIENLKAPKKRKDEFKKTLQSLKRKGELITPVVPSLHHATFRRPGGKLDWEMYNIMRKNILQSKEEGGQDERDVYSEGTSQSNPAGIVDSFGTKSSSNEATSKISGPSSSGGTTTKSLESVIGFDFQDPLGFNIVGSKGGPSASHLSVPSLDAEPMAVECPPIVKTVCNISEEIQLPSFTLVAVDPLHSENEDSPVKARRASPRRSVRVENNSSSCNNSEEKNQGVPSSVPPIPELAKSSDSTITTKLESGNTETDPPRRRLRRIKAPHIRVPGPGGGLSKTNKEKKSDVEEIEIEITCK